MRFQRFINENDDVEELKGLISKCKKFLKDWNKCGSIKGDFLYSGRRFKGNYFVGETRKNRQPKNTHPDVQEKLDIHFEEKFGVKARGNSIFTTGDEEIAGSYGTLYMIFPIGKYKIIWSDKIRDLFTLVMNKTEITDGEAKEIVDQYKSGDLCNAIGSENEVMLLCDRYLAIDDYMHRNNIDKIIEEVL